MTNSRSRHLVDPEFRALLDAMPRVPVNADTLARFYAALEGSC